VSEVFNHTVCIYWTSWL